MSGIRLNFYDTYTQVQDEHISKNRTSRQMTEYNNSSNDTLTDNNNFIYCYMLNFN